MQAPANKKQVHCGIYNAIEVSERYRALHQAHGNESTYVTMLMRKCAMRFRYAQKKRSHIASSLLIFTPGRSLGHQLS